MRILGLDTATRATVAAICDGDIKAEWRDDPAAGGRPGHSALLLAQALGAMGETGTTWATLDRIAVGVGPGTFTGLRIGIATAQALAIANGIPLVGVSTLQSLALMAAPAAVDEGAELIAAVVDARRSELFAAAWSPATVATPGSEPVIAARPYPPRRLAEALRAARGTAMAVGDGSIPFRALLGSCGAVIPPDDSQLHRVSAIGHCQLGALIAPGAAAAVAPAYLRLPDAELARRAAQR